MMSIFLLSKNFMQCSDFTNHVKIELLNANVNNDSVHMQKRILCLKSIHADIYRKSLLPSPFGCHVVFFILHVHSLDVLHISIKKIHLFCNCIKNRFFSVALTKSYQSYNIKKGSVIFTDSRNSPWFTIYWKLSISSPVVEIYYIN